MKIYRTAFPAVVAAFASLVLAWSSMAQAADATPPAALFVPITGRAPAQDPGMAADPSVFRSRFVKVNSDVTAPADGKLQRAPSGTEALVLNLFEDVTLTAVIEQREVRSSRSFTWIGHIEGMSRSDVTLVVEGDVMAANIRTPGAYYQVRYVAPDLHAVRQIDETRYPREAEPIPVQLPKTEAARDSHITAADDGTTFDVLVVYTPAARAAAGGPTAMTALINLAVAETNTAYSRSAVIPRVRLAHSEEVDYVETDNFRTDLDRLTNPSDSFMDNVHTLRNAHAADLVVLLVEGNSLCGIAWLMTNESHSFEEFAFSVTNRDCATGNYTFGHEMGHNMGLQHDRADAPENGVFPYSHGYVDVAHGFRTIMGVQPEPPCCIRIQNFSNPSVTFSGSATGVPQPLPDSADAATSLNNTRVTVANWRASAVVVTPLTLNSSSLPEGEVGVPYSASLSAAGGSPPYTMTLISGALPAGLTISGDEIAGTPGVAGKPTLTLRVTDQLGSSVSRKFRLTVDKAVTIATSRLSAARSGRNYKATLKPSGGKKPYTWSSSGGLPAGLSLNSSNGQITGVAVGPGSFTPAFEVTDALGGTAPKTLTLEVR